MDSANPNEIIDKHDFCSKEAENVRVITSKMKLYPPDSQYIDKCFQSILNLAREGDIGTESISYILYYMKQRIGSYDICEMSCDIYYEIARRSNRNRVGCVDAVPVIVVALGKFIHSTEFCKRALVALSEINGEDLGLWRKCAESDCFSLYMSILKKRKTSSDLCRYACIGLVKMLASPHPYFTTPNRHDADRVFSNGGIEVLLDILDYHFYNDDIGIYVSTAIEYITGLCSETSTKCVKAGIVPIIIDIIEQKKHNASLVESVCSILLNISDYGLIGGEDVKETISVLINVLKEHAYNETICLVVTLTLINIGGGNMDCALENMATDALVSVQNIHENNPKIIADTGKLLHLIATKDVCLHPHVLSPASHQGYCDICKSMAAKFMGCRECDYDQCLLCAANY